MIMFTIINYTIPLLVLGLSANFIPFLIVLIPVFEQDICWFYFLTRAPNRMNFVPNWLYYLNQDTLIAISMLFLTPMLYYVWVL